MRGSRLTLFLSAGLALVAAALPSPVAADGACRAEGRVEISSKLVCPQQPVELRFSMRLRCAADATPSCIRAVRIVDPLPAGIAAWQPEEGGAAPDTSDDWSLEFTDGFGGSLETSRHVVALHAGAFALGGAEIEVVDDEGRSSVTKLEPTLLTVVPECPRNNFAPLFLPIVHRPACLPARGPMDVVLAIDRSASVGDGLADVTRGATTLLDALNLEPEVGSRQLDRAHATRDRAAVVAFDGWAEVVAPLGASRTRLFDALAALQPRHGTRFEHVLDTAGQVFDARSSHRRRIVVLVTDGVAIGGGGDGAARAAAQRLRASGVRILAVGIGPAPDWPLLGALSESGSPRIAARDAAALPTAFRAVATAARCVRAGGS